MPPEDPAPTRRVPVDRVVRGSGEVATAVGRGPAHGAELGRVTRIPRGAVAIDAGRVVFVGSEAEIDARFEARATTDAAGGLVVPGFVDAHTHPVFAGTREAEFEMRTAGASYTEIALAGGGILSSVRGVREASEDELVALLLVRLDRFLEQGTTTVEAKSGYGLDVDSELKSLRAIARADALHPVDVVPTFLGAHAYPPEYADRREAYVDVLVEEMLPAVAEARLASYADVFTEAHTFDIAASRRIMRRAKELGLGLRMHVDQLSPLGGASLAAELGAATADHCERSDDAAFHAMAAASVQPVLCPLVPLYLREERHEARARRMVDAGLAPVLSTDFNPGSCYTQSMLLTLTFAALRYRMTAAECLVASTLNAAASLGRGDRLGTIEVGKDADLLVVDVPNLEHLVYEFGRDAVRTVVKRGSVVLERPPFAAERGQVRA
ncbi:MAG: imidazolonepropionase [Planctomycetota bacterium]